MTIQLTTAGVRIAPSSHAAVRSLIYAHGTPIPSDTLRATEPTDRVFRVDAPVSGATPTAVHIGGTRIAAEIRRLFAPEYQAVAGEYPPELQIPISEPQYRNVVAHHGTHFANMLMWAIIKLPYGGCSPYHDSGVIFESPRDHVYLRHNGSHWLLHFPLVATHIDAPWICDLNAIHGADADMCTPLIVAMGSTPDRVRSFSVPKPMIHWLRTSPLYGPEAEARWAVARRVYFASAIPGIRLLASAGLARYEAFDFRNIKGDSRNIKGDFRVRGPLCGYRDLLQHTVPTLLELYGTVNGLRSEAVPPAYTSQGCHICHHIGLRHKRQRSFKCTNPRCNVTSLPDRVNAALSIRGGGMLQHLDRHR